MVNSGNIWYSIVFAQYTLGHLMDFVNRPDHAPTLFLYIRVILSILNHEQLWIPTHEGIHNKKGHKRDFYIFQMTASIRFCISRDFLNKSLRELRSVVFFS